MSLVESRDVHVLEALLDWRQQIALEYPLTYQVERVIIVECRDATADQDPRRQRISELALELDPESPETHGMTPG